MHTIVAMMAIIICLLVVVGIHELGHALAAKLFGIQIKRISLGFGKTLWRWPIPSGYQVDLNLWLLGGRVHLLNSRVKPVPTKQYPLCFDKKPIWVRTIVLVSGSLANIVVAYLALILMFMIGFKQLSPVITKIIIPSNAATAGFHRGDRITQMAGKPTNYWRDVGMQFITHVGENQIPVTTCAIDGQCRDLQLSLKVWDNQSNELSLFHALGIVPDTQHIVIVKGLPFWQALIQACSELMGLVCFFLVMIKQILIGNIPFGSLLGPFKLFETIIDSFFQGLSIFLYFVANFSLAMAIINLLPIPSLDGGSIIFGLIEKIRGKPMSVALEVLIYRLFFIALALLLVQLIVNDLHHYRYAHHG